MAIRATFLSCRKCGPFTPVAYGRRGLCIEPCLRTWRHELVEGCHGDAMVGFVVAVVVVVVDVVLVVFVAPDVGRLASVARCARTKIKTN